MINSKQKEKFHQQLQTLWAIEHRLVQVLPQLIEKANDFGLKKSLAYHFAETRQHKTAIEGICKQFEYKLKKSERDHKLETILQNTEKMITDQHPPGEVDANIIAGAIEVEQYEISVYGPAASVAKQMGLKGIAQRLNLTLEEERQSDTKLRFLETQLLNQRAEIGQLAHEPH